MDRDDKILAYLQDRLSGSQRVAFEAEMDGDAGLAAEVSVLRETRAALTGAASHPDTEGGWERLSAAIDGTAAPANDNRPPWRRVLEIAAVATIAIVAWQIIAVPRIGPDGASPVFDAASEASETFTLQVIFAPSAAISDVTTLITDLDGRVTDGPSALGVIRITFDDETSLRAAQTELSGRADLVETVLAE